VRIGLVSALVIVLYFLLIGWAVSICELEFRRFVGARIEFPPHQHLLPAPGQVNAD
jgi:hypothetical protein